MVLLNIVLTYAVQVVSATLLRQNMHWILLLKLRQVGHTICGTKMVVLILTVKAVGTHVLGGDNL